MKMKTIRETLDRRVIDPDTRDRWITGVYMTVTLLMLMHHVYITLYFAVPENGAITFRFVWIFLGCATVLMGRMWKDKCFWILLALLLLKFLRIAIPMRYRLRELQDVYELCFYAFFICYGAGRVLNRKDRQTFIELFCGLWTAAMTVYACFGLYTVWNNTVIPNLGNMSFYIHISEDRLWPIYHPVEAGTLTAVSIAVAVTGYFLSKRKAVRWLYLPAVLLMFLMGVFCSSRTSYILTAAGIGAVLTILIHELLCRWKKQGKAYTLLRLAAAGAAFAGLTVLLLFLQMKAIPAYNSLRSQETSLISSAAAEPAETDLPETAGTVPAEEPEAEDAAGTETEEPVKAQLNTRDFVLDQGTNGFLTGRWAIWVHVCDGFQHYPIYALIGQGVYDPMHHINYYIRFGNGQAYIYHLHSTFIQTLWESGIPGFLLFFAFFVIFAWNAVRLISDRSLPFWQRILPIPAALGWLADMVDCSGYCNYGKPPMTLLYLFTGLTIVIARENRKNKKLKEQQTNE